MKTQTLRYKYLGLGVALAVTTVFSTAYALADTPQATATAIPATKPVVKATPAAASGKSNAASETRFTEEWLIEQENTPIPVIDQLGQHLQAARQYFDEKNDKAAATEIRQGAEFLQKEELGPGSEQDVAERATAANDLIKLADGVEQGKVTSLDELNLGFRAAYRADIEHGFVHLTAEERAPLVEKSSLHLQRATEALNNKDIAAAAGEIYKGISFLKIEEAAAAGPTKERLHHYINSLEDLAIEVSKGQVTAAENLDKVFAQAHYALTQHHQLQASAAMARDELKEAGFELRAAAHHLEQTLTRSGHKIEGDSAAQIKSLNELADKLVAGDKVDAKEVNQAIEKVNQELEGLGKEISIETPYEWLVIDQNTFIPVVDDLARYLRLAHLAFMKQDYKGAAQDINEGAAFMKVEETKLADEAAKTEFKNVVAELEQLAGKVEQGQLTKVEELNTTLLKAYDTDVTYRWARVSGEQASALVEWPITYLGQARTDFKQKENLMAADEIFKAIGFLKLEKARTNGTTQEALQRSITDLTQVAQQIREGQLKSDTDMDNAFIRAYHALGSHYYLRASSAVAQNNLKEAGYELKAATHYLEQAQAHLNQQPVVLHTDLLKMADEIIAEKYPSADTLNQGLKQIGQEIEKVGQEIEQMTSAKKGDTTAKKQTVS